MPQITHHDLDGHAVGPAATGWAATRVLADLGIDSGRWALRSQPVSSTPLLTYARELHALQRRVGAVMTDRVRQPPSLRGTRGARVSPASGSNGLNWPEPAQVHVHHDAEVRVLLQGRATFAVRAGDGWLAVACEPGEWLILPAGLPHRLQIGLGEEVEMLRLYARPGGWRAEATGSVLPASWQSWAAPEPSALQEALAA